MRFILLTSELSQQRVPWQNDRTPDPYTTVVLYINVNLNIIKICLRGLQTAVEGEKIHKREAENKETTQEKQMRWIWVEAPVCWCSRRAR